MSKELVTKEYKNVVEAFKKGKFPGRPVVRRYEHPIAKRKIMKSNKQITDSRRG
jgi:hypothetical protein